LSSAQSTRITIALTNRVRKQRWWVCLRAKDQTIKAKLMEEKKNIKIKTNKQIKI